MKRLCPYCGSDDIEENEEEAGFYCNNCWQFVPFEYEDEWIAHNQDTE